MPDSQKFCSVSWNPAKHFFPMYAQGSCVGLSIATLVDVAACTFTHRTCFFGYSPSLLQEPPSTHGALWYWFWSTCVFSDESLAILLLSVFQEFHFRSYRMAPFSRHDTSLHSPRFPTRVSCCRIQAFLMIYKVAHFLSKIADNERKIEAIQKASGTV
jgi:hypothetical protein